MRFVRRAARRFMPGEEAEDALREAETLQTAGAPTLLTLLGENVDDQAAADRVVEEYLRVLAEARRRGVDAELSVKPTQLGLELGEDITRRNLEALVIAAGGSRGSRGSSGDAEGEGARGQAAADGGDPRPLVWIDMEGSEWVDPTLRIFRELRARHPNLGICLQAYLHRTPDDIRDLMPLEPAVRLVKGAYREPPDVALPRKRDVDARYVELAAALLRARLEGRAGRPGIATHDGRIIREIGRRADALGLAPDAWEYEMLYGIGTAEQRRLVAEGRRLRVLISYGEHWFPWYMRRLAERPANLGFVLRKMVGL